MRSDMIGVVLAIGVGLLVGFVRRGSLGNLGDAHLRGVPIVFVGVAFQVGSMLAERARLDWIPLALILTSFACVFIFAALNWRLSGMALAALGALSNFVVIAANGGMPVSLEAAARAGLGNPFEDPASVAKGAHHAMTDDSVLTFLADVIPLRIGANVVSVGDILIWAGLLVIVQQLMVGPKGRRRHGTRQREAAAS